MENKNKLFPLSLPKIDLLSSPTTLLSIIQDCSSLLVVEDDKVLLSNYLQYLRKYLSPTRLIFSAQRQNTSTLTQYSFSQNAPFNVTLSNKEFSILKEVFSRSKAILTTGNAVLFSDIKECATSSFSDTFLSLNIEIVVPLFFDQEPYLFTLFSKKADLTSYTFSDLFYIKQLTQTFSIKQQSLQSYRESTLDAKTKLYNYTFFLKQLNRSIAIYRRHTIPYALLMVDIDNFKAFNDTYGHLAGDAMLVSISKLFTASVRQEDIVARFGGEEFLLLLANCAKEGIYTVAERIRKKIEDFRLKNTFAALESPFSTSSEEEELQITVSIGGVSFSDITELKSDNLIYAVDKALYLSKENGKNCSTLYAPA